MSRIGELLVREKMLSLQQLQQAQDEAKRTGKRRPEPFARALGLILGLLKLLQRQHLFAD